MPDHAGAIYLFSRAAAAAAVEDVSREAGLLDRARSGDEEAFREIYSSFAGMIHGILLARVPYDDVGDLVQEVFLLAYRNLDSLREPGALGAWLARIARNRAVEYYRSAKPNVELTDELRAPEGKTAEAIEVLAAIRSLPDAYCETLILRLVEGMTGNEIAERTGLKPESVRVNLHRGMEMLRSRLRINGARK